MVIDRAAVRSLRAEVRNPILSLPSIDKLRNLSPEARDALEAILRDLSRDAAGRAQRAWVTNKGPMAAYWKSVGVYAKHIARAIASNRRSRHA